MLDEEVLDRFRSHEMDDDQLSRVTRLKRHTLALVEAVEEEMPSGRAKSVVLTKLEEASFFMTAGIARDG